MSIEIHGRWDRSSNCSAGHWHLTAGRWQERDLGHIMPGASCANQLGLVKLSSPAGELVNERCWSPSQAQIQARLKQLYNQELSRIWKAFLPPGHLGLPPSTKHLHPHTVYKVPCSKPGWLTQLRKHQEVNHACAMPGCFEANLAVIPFICLLYKSFLEHYGSSTGGSANKPWQGGCHFTVQQQKHSRPAAFGTTSVNPNE